MAATKSTLNTNLAKVSDIGSYISYAQGTYTLKVYLPWGASRAKEYIGFKQPAGRANPYQMQWRQTFRRTLPKEIAAGAAWTGWTSGWKAAQQVVAAGGLPAIAKDATTDVDTWRRGNKGVDTGSWCTWAITMDNFSIPADYDASSIALRIRTFNYATCRHGAWTEAEIKYYRCCDVQDTTFVLAPDGGLYLAFNQNHTREVTVTVQSVVLDGEEILIAPGTQYQVKQQKRTSTTTPKLRTNYTGGMVHIPATDLAKALSMDDTLTVTYTVLTDLGAPTEKTHTAAISSNSTSVAVPQITATENRAAGTATVVLTGTGAYNDVGVTVVAEDGTQLQPLSATRNATGQPVYTATYAIPQDGGMYKVQGFATNDYDCTGSTSVFLLQSRKTNYCYITSEKTGETTVLAGDLSLTVDRNAEVTAERPIGASANMAAWYAGTGGSISLSGIVLDGRYKSDLMDNQITYTNSLNQVYEMSKSTGKYLIRMPDGRNYTGVVESVNVSQDTAFSASVSISFVEV